jgi:hypothetical protein
MKRLKYYGGQGYSYSKEIGKYEVKSNQKTKIFDRLSDARNYYDSLNVGKAIWDVSGMAELLEAHT